MLLKKLKLICAFVSILSLFSCSSNNDRKLQIRHSFAPLTTSTFNFDLTWFVPPSVLFGNEKQSIIANMGLKTSPRSEPRLNISNETRLKLEELSIKRLENELVENDMCAQGYKIESTQWLERSIQHNGSCINLSQ